MTAGHSLHQLQLVLYAHRHVGEKKKINPRIQVLMGKQGIHNPLMLTKYTVFKDKSHRRVAWKSQARSGSGIANVWRDDKCDRG